MIPTLLRQDRKFLIIIHFPSSRLHFKCDKHGKIIHLYKDKVESEHYRSYDAFKQLIRTYYFQTMLLESTSMFPHSKPSSRITNTTKPNSKMTY